MFELERIHPAYKPETRQRNGSLGNPIEDRGLKPRLVWPVAHWLAKGIKSERRDANFWGDMIHSETHKDNSMGLIGGAVRITPLRNGREKLVQFALDDEPGGTNFISMVQGRNALDGSGLVTEEEILLSPHTMVKQGLSELDLVVALAKASHALPWQRDHA